MHAQVIADLYEKYIELIGTVVDDEGNTKSDGYARHARATRRARWDEIRRTDRVLSTAMPWTKSA